jgi:predicted dinucleotide-binding enzyme
VRIGIIGSGHIGATAAELFEEAGHEVRVGNSRGGVEEAAGFGELVLVAIPLKAYEDLPADAFEDTIVVDAMNYYPSRDGHIAELDRDETTSSELLARHLDGATVVKAFNTMAAATLAEDGRPAGDPHRLVLFVAGDSPMANRTVVDLIDEIGFDGVITGSLAEGGRLQQPGSPVYGAELTIAEAQEALGDR